MLNTVGSSGCYSEEKKILKRFLLGLGCSASMLGGTSDGSEQALAGGDDALGLILEMTRCSGEHFDSGWMS